LEVERWKVGGSSRFYSGLKRSLIRFGKMCFCDIDVLVAQSAEHPALTRKAVGSWPTQHTKIASRVRQPLSNSR